MQEEQIREALNQHWQASASGDINGAAYPERRMKA